MKHIPRTFIQAADKETWNLMQAHFCNGTPKIQVVKLQMAYNFLN